MIVPCCFNIDGSANGTV